MDQNQEVTSNTANKGLATHKGIISGKAAEPNTKQMNTIGEMSNYRKRGGVKDEVEKAKSAKIYIYI